MRRKLVIPTLLILGTMVLPAGGDIIMTPVGLNQTLKKMVQLKRQIESGSPQEKAEALLQLGVESKALATLINDEMTAHGMEQKALIDLSLKRTKALGIAITYNQQKDQFFYDGEAFGLYIEQEPVGRHVAVAKFNLLEKQFFESSGRDIESLLKGLKPNQEFLTRYPEFERNGEVRLFLAIDYRDLYRYYRDRNEIANLGKYEKLARQQFQSIVKVHPNTDQSEIARELLNRLNEEIQQQPYP